MDTVLKTILVYFALLCMLRLAGRRTIGQLSSFDLVVTLIIGGATQRALLGQDYSVVNALLVVTTLIVLDVGISLIERDWPTFAKLVNGNPLIVVERGRLLRDRMRRARLTEGEVLSVARRHGLERLDDVKYAILEASGDISIIPERQPTKA
jgi:uncharacterized membrane protein YcaP (DUF421 family)